MKLMKRDKTGATICPECNSRWYYDYVLAVEVEAPHSKPNKVDCWYCRKPYKAGE